MIGLAWLALMVNSMQDLYKLCVDKQEKLYGKMVTRIGGSLSALLAQGHSPGKAYLPLQRGTKFAQTHDLP